MSEWPQHYGQSQMLSNSNSNSDSSQLEMINIMNRVRVSSSNSNLNMNMNMMSHEGGSSLTNTLSPEGGRVTKPVRRRSRASRRTPTTLLNTDTTNFRAMVQQFTGGPANNPTLSFPPHHQPNFTLAFNSTATNPYHLTPALQQQQQLISITNTSTNLQRLGNSADGLAMDSPNHYPTPASSGTRVTASETMGNANTSFMF